VPETLDALAGWTGESPEQLLSWQTAGLLPDDEGTPLPARLERIRLIRFALAHGYRGEELAEIAATHGDMIGPFAEQVGALVGEPVCTLEEASQRAGLDVEVLETVLAASGMADERFATREEIAAAGLIKAALDYGLPPEMLTQLLHVFSDATNKIAEAGVRLFHLHVHNQLRATGTGGAELLEATNAIAAPFMALAEPAVVYLFRKSWQRALREDMLLHLAEEATTPSSVPGELTRAILFADLAGFTPLTEVEGDSAAARVIAAFSELVRTVAARCSGQIVKQIGDEFMLVFPDGRAAVACGVELRKIGAEDGLPAMRIGAHSGPVLYREGDYLGSTVNVASRVTDSAAHNQFLVTKAVQEQVAHDVDAVGLGARLLKGLTRETELFEVRGSRVP